MSTRHAALLTNFGREEMKMRKYESPEIVVIFTEMQDILTVSQGDTPNMFEEW